MRRIAAFLFHQMAQVFVAHDAKQLALAPMHRGQLKVDHRGKTIRVHQPVLRFGEVIVRHIPRTHFAQDALGVFVKCGGVRFC